MGRDNLGCHIEAVYLRCSAATVGNLRMTKARVDGNGLGLSTVARSSNWTGPPTRFALRWATFACIHERRLVGAGGIEPPTPRV